MGKIELTPRETQVLEKIRQGFTSGQIAKSLKVSVRTIEVHRFNLRLKLGLRFLKPEELFLQRVASLEHRVHRLEEKAGIAVPE